MELTETAKIEPSKEPYALVLCGGGAAGRWQAGVMTALSQAGVVENASLICGTSVGGINAALFALCAGNPAKAVALWESIKNNSDVYKGNLNLFGKIGAGLGFLFGADSILDPAPLYKRIDSIWGDMTLLDVYAQNKIHVVLSGQDLNLLQEEFYSSFNLQTCNIKAADAIKRTSAIPGVFKAVPGQDDGEDFTHWHVDGGVGMNTPFLAIDAYDATFPDTPIKKAVIVYCYPDNGAGDISKASFKNYRDAILRTIPAMLTTQEQVTEMVIRDKVRDGWEVMAIYPNEKPCETLEFNKTSALHDGYNHAVKGEGYSYNIHGRMNIKDFLR